MTFVKFNFKFANPSKSYEIHKTRIRRFAFTLLAKHVVIQDQQGDHTASVFLKESFRPVVLLLSYTSAFM
jgi:hypothetical protein